MTGPTGRHRCQLGQHREHPIGLLERSGRERAESVEPLAPVGRGGQTVELIDEREGVAGEGGEVVERSRQRRRLRLVFLAKLGEPEPQLVGESVDPTSPAIAPADHRRLDEKTLPAARRPELPVSDRGFVDACGRSSGLDGSGRLIDLLGRELRDELRVGGDPSVPARSGLRRRAAGRRVRHLPKRQVLGEAPRRQAFGCTLEQCTEGSPGRVGSHRAACEVNRNVRSGERLLEMGAVLLR